MENIINEIDDFGVLDEVVENVREHIVSDNGEKALVIREDGRRMQNQSLLSGDCVYAVEHCYYQDWGSSNGSDEFTTTLFVTTNKKLAEDFIKKYNHTLEHQSDDYDYESRGGLQLRIMPLVKEFDINKFGPEHFGGDNTLGFDSLSAYMEHVEEQWRKEREHNEEEVNL